MILQRVFVWVVPKIPRRLADNFQTLYYGKKKMRRFDMPFWQRLVFTLIIIVVASFIAGLVWHRIFSFSLPSYVGGVIGGLVAVPFWELLKRKSPKKKKIHKHLS
jgi:Na+/glutamate symporter